MVKVTVSSKNNVIDPRELLEKAAKVQVLVGIPQAEASRTGEPINNAELLYIHTHGVRKKQMRDDMKEDLKKKPYSAAYELYIHTHGSPLWKSPPRPVIEPAIEANKDVIAELIRDAITQYVTSNGSLDGFKKVGMYGASVSKDWFHNPNNSWAPNSPITIAKKGSDAPLIDTGALRQAITYVIKER